MRAAILSRFSTDKQRAASCDDQIRVCRARADLDGWAIVAVYRDEAISGTVPIARRPGGARMLADALASRFDVLLLEGLDRLTRDAAEQERIVRRLEFRGIRLIGVSDGYDSTSKARKLHRGMRGLINEIYLDDLREKVHRGLDGLVARKLNAGGLPYGYRSVPVADGHRLEVDAQKAGWVRYIYERSAAGVSARTIAAELNHLHVPAPRGGTWAFSAIYGSPNKGCGILNNTVYRGLYVWNRSQWLKDPDTGRRRRIERPRAEWREVDLPHLRIVPDALWHAARARIGARKPGEPTRAPRSAFSGLLRCGRCGGAVVAVSKYQYGCAARKDRGPSVCDGVRVNRRALEQTLLNFIRRDLLSDAAERRLLELIREELRARRRTAAGTDRAARERLAALDRQIANLVDAIATAGFSPALKARLAAAEASRERARAELAQAAAPPLPEAVPRAIERIRRAVFEIERNLRRVRDEARAALKGLLGEIRLVPDRDGGRDVIAELSGVYAGILAAVAYQRPVIRPRVAGDRSDRSNHPGAGAHDIRYTVRIPRKAA
jgi:DNA invertase Pin-like site-specific DNA recombinase